MTNLIINFATRGRPEAALRSMENISYTISGNNSYKIIVSIDSDDEAMDDMTIAKMLAYPNTKVICRENKNKVEAINAGCNVFGEFYWLVNHSDDMQYVVKGWDEKMLASIKKEWGESTDFFAHFNDNFVGDKLPTINICGYDYFKRDNNIYDPSYGSVSADAENWHKAKMRGRHKYFPEVYVSHDHPANIPSLPIDKTYRRNDKWGDLDTKNYFHRMSYGFFVEKPIMIPFEVQEHINIRLNIK